MTQPRFKERLASLLMHVPELSFRELDRLAGISQGYSAQIISGAKPNPGKAFAEAIGGVLGARWAWLLGDDGEDPGERVVRDAVRRARRRHGRIVALGGATSK